MIQYLRLSLVLLLITLQPGRMLLAEEIEGLPGDDMEQQMEEPTDLGLGAADKSGNEWLVAPIPGRNPTFGWTLTMPVAYLYHPKTVDQESPPWITGAMGFYAENGSWAGGVFHRMNLDKDRYRFGGALVYSDITYNYYGSGETPGDKDHYLELIQTFGVGILDAKVRVADNLYVGMGVLAMGTTIEDIRFPGLDIDFPNLFEGLKMQLVDLVPKIVYDTRDNEFYPQRGTYINAQVNISAEGWGSDFDYQIYEASWNQYFSLAENQVLAFRMSGKYASGRVPFFRLPAVGQGGDFRGFVMGRYRDKVLAYSQLEYRIRLTERIGLVAFGGLGGVAPEWDEFDKILTNYGVGARWVLAKENNISFRVDVARGGDNTEIYLGVGEAF